MLNKIISLSIKNKLIAILITLSIAAFGVFAIFQIPVGAVPDITNNQVQVITTSTNLSTQDVEQFITYPVELEMSNLPGVEEIRSISKFGLSVVTIVFDEKMGTYLPRQLIAEKIKTAAENIPEGFGTPEMGPISTGLGEIYQYVLDTKPGYKDKYSIMELRTIQDWIVKRQLSGIPGIVEVNTWGGFLKQYEVAVNPEKIKSFNISLLEVFNAIEANNSIAGGAYIERSTESYFIRGNGLVNNLEDLEKVVVKNRENGLPILVRDIAEVRFGSANRFGAITANGEGEKVMGQIMMLKDANSNKVIDAVKERVAEVQETLPEGIFINPIVERSELISKTSDTIFENILFGILIVFVTVVLLMGNLRTGLVIASIIPLSFLFTIAMMYIFGIDANLMSLGALDFGIIIDGAVIITEFTVLRVTANKNQLANKTGKERQTLMDNITFDGASKMINNAIFGQIIILIVFIPVLSLTGVEGKMFRPMALAFSFALLGAMFFGFVWLPVAASLFLRPEPKKKFRITEWIMKILYRSYDPVIKWSYNHKGVIFGLAIASLVATGFIFSRMGGEFVPTLDEGDFVIQPVLKTGTSLSKTIDLTTQMEQILIDNFPEVDQIVCRIGAAEVPTDPMSMEEIDMIIKLNPKKTWVSADSKEELANRFKEKLSVLPNIEYEFTQPIEMRFNELITGVRADLAIKIFGEDLKILADKAEEISQLIQDVPGAADIIIEKTEGLPQMIVDYKRDKLAYYGLTVAELNKYLTTGFAGGVAGSVFEGERRFDLVTRLHPDYRNDIEHLRNLFVSLPNGSQIPMKELADIYYTTGPAKISRDDAKRRVVVSVNVRNSDLETVVEEIEEILTAQLELPAGYNVDYGGQFENLENASRRLKIAVPIALLLIIIFLHFAFGSLREAAMVFSAIPLSIVGGVMLLWIRGMPFSISAGIGFIALFGVAVLNAIILIDYLKELKAQGITDMRERIMQGTRERLRPVLLTASSTALGFLPMAISTSAGAEVQRPLATVVIGGMVTSTLLTMLMLPLLYSVFDGVTGIQWRPLKLKKKKITTLLLILILPASLIAQQNVNRQANNDPQSTAEKATNAQTIKSVSQTGNHQSASSEGQDKNAGDPEILNLEQALEYAYQSNNLLSGYEAQAEEQSALIKTAFSIDKTTLYYNYDENNIAVHNDYPIGVIGGEQRFDFPTLYFAQKKANTFEAEMARNKAEQIKRTLARDVSQAYYKVLYLQKVYSEYENIAGVYEEYASAAETGYEQGEYTYLEMLNAVAQQNRLKMKSSQFKSDLEIEKANLAALIQHEGTIETDTSSPEIMKIQVPDLSVDPGLKLRENALSFTSSMERVEKNKLLPDITLGFFNGTNSYANAQNYQGFEIGLGIPLFFGEQKARIKAQKHATTANEHFLANYRTIYRYKTEKLLGEVEKYRIGLDYYMQDGKKISEEIFRAAKISFDAGEIDFLQLVQVMDRALEMELEYLNLVNKYNMLVAELNYFTVSE